LFAYGGEKFENPLSVEESWNWKMGALNHDGRVDHQTKLQNIPKKCTTPTMVQKEVGILLASQPRNTPKQTRGIWDDAIWYWKQQDVPIILLAGGPATWIDFWHYLSVDQNFQDSHFVQHCSTTFVGSSISTKTTTVDSTAKRPALITSLPAPS